MIVPGAVINCRPIGVLMEDDAGQDEKILAAPSGTASRHYESVTSFSDLPAITCEQIEHFFSHYKDLEPNKWVRIDHWGDDAEARSMIEATIARGA